MGEGCGGVSLPFFISKTMATSTTNLLEVGNAVLANVNERPLPSLSGLTGIQIRNAIRDSLIEINNAADWVWLQDRINPTAWSGSIAYLSNNVSQIRSVGYQPSTVANQTSIRTLQFLTPEEYDHYPLVSYTTGARPLRWTYFDYNAIRVNPYTTDVTEQAKLWCYVRYNLSLPSSESTAFAMPEEFIPLLITKTTQRYALRHMEDAGLAAAFEAEYQQLLQQHRGRHTVIPHKKLNLYGGTRSTYGSKW